jgi:hypothetical protein
MTLRYNISVISVEVFTAVTAEIVVFWFVTLALMFRRNVFPAPLELKCVWQYQWH